jgi:hypothetical protein
MPSADAGFRVRLETARAALAAVVGEVDPDCLDGTGATELYASFAGLERLAVAGKTLVAPRIEGSGVWRNEGHRNAAAMLAQLEGVSTGQARNTLDVGRRLDQLPGTRDAVRTGKLSGAKVNELTGAGILDPEHEQELLAGADDQPLQTVKERCNRSRATSGARDPVATIKRIRDERYFSSWTDPDGAFCYQGKDTADRGAQILSRLGPVATALRQAAKAATGGTGEPTESERAFRADAFFALITRRYPGVGSQPAPGPDDGPDPSDLPTDGPDSHIDPGLDPDVTPDGPDPDIDPDLDPDIDPDTLEPPPEGGPEELAIRSTGEPSVDALSIIDRPPACSVVVRVDLDALLRGHAERGEICEIDNQGPVPVPMARDMANDSFLRFVFHRAGDIRAVSHFGRTINRNLRTALVYRDTTCVVPGCGVSFGLEIDHIVPVAEHGPTELDNLALLCHHHHYLKTYEGWTLERTDLDENGRPTWRFEPQPPFGQEPGLGINTPEGKEAWRRLQK